MTENEWGITYATIVHLHLTCQSCDFETWEYIHGVKTAEAHHHETGHEIEGEQGLAVWIGKEGNTLLQDRARRLLGDPIVDDPR